MDIEPGLRVVRGPDWKWDDQDGGEGYLGTVAEAPAGDRAVPEGVVVVQWDVGNRCEYRCGIEGKYDLKVYDNAPTGNAHPHVMCDSCHKRNIPGIRWKCTRCYDFDLCTPCYYSGKHYLDHPFWRIDKGKSHQGVVVPARESSRKVLAKGFFQDAEVARGRDWLWGDQDGGLGNSGVVKAVKDHTDTSRSIVEVEWIGSHKTNIYRAGHKGKVDVKCMTVGVGNHFYPDHLLVLGVPAPVEDIRDPQQQASPLPSPDSSTPKIKAGDRVKVQLEADVFRMMQDGHGGWNDQMAEVLSEVGTVHTVLDSGDIRVRYPSNLIWTMNPDTVTVLEAGQFSVGDVVRVLDDIAKVHNLQENHGGWVDDIALSLGQVGRITKVFPTGDVRVNVNGRTWTFNSACLIPAPGENPPEIPASPGSDIDTDDIRTQLRMLSLIGNPATVVAAAAAGDADMVRSYLTRHPLDVNTKASGKAALHCASVAGNVPVIKAILEFNPDLEIEDEDGDKPLHLCAYCDEDEVAKLLIDRGAKINSVNRKGATPLIIAAVKGHHSVLRILTNHPQIKIHEQDSDGDTALHCAVLAQKNESVSILLGAGADPTRVNFRLFTPIHEAARIGFLPAIEQFARAKYDLNLKKDDGFAAIHLAALNDHLDVTTTLAELDSCNINGKTNIGQTALHLAVHQGHARIVERLVGFGIDLNLQDNDGDTALHIALTRATIDVLSTETPQLKKVRESFGQPGDVGPHATATVACFLIQEGASFSLLNKKGHTPLQACSPEVVSLVMNFKDSLTIRKPLKFHGSLGSPVVSSPTSPITMYTVGGGGKSGGLAVGAPAPAEPVPQLPVIQPQPPVSGQQPTQPVQVAAIASSNQDSCFLCESPVDIKFEPCGHAMMCSTCAQRAKKCPQCKAIVKTLSKLKVMCPMCNDEEVSVTMKPCGHEFCPGCARRMKICFDCRNVITSKEGLPAETRNTGSSESSGPNCAICLTEPRNTALLCGHQLCWDCAQKVDHCPVCRKFVTHRIQLF